MELLGRHPRRQAADDDWLEKLGQPLGGHAERADCRQPASKAARDDLPTEAGAQPVHERRDGRHRADDAAIDGRQRERRVDHRPIDLVEFRRSIYEQYGFTFGASYQQLFQWTSATARTADFDTALGGWAAVSTTWTALDRGGPYEGTLVVRGAFRGSLGDNAVPAVFGLRDIGSLWSNYEWTSWNQGFRSEDLFWEHKIGSQFSFRVGNQGPQAVFNFFRFKDARTGFTASPAAFNETIPYPTFGLGASFRLRPIVTDPGVYVVGTLNDMNGDPAANGLDWSTFGKRQYFYGVELGKDWRRDNGEFDHLHLDLFYADRRSTRNPDTSPNVAGGGFKLAGEKQIGQIVAFANYVYNTAQGGGISTTVSRHTAITGVAYLRPFDI